jgi:signal transduction histidine kinase
MSDRLTKLIDRWDVDPVTRTALPFDRAMALLNLRRAEVACVLELLTDVLQITTGYRLGSMFVGIAVAIVFLICARLAQGWRSLTAQQAVMVVFLITAFALKQWGAAELGNHGRISSGFPFTLLTMTLLVVIPPRAMVLIVVTTMLSYSGIILNLPVAHQDKISAIVSTGIIAVIALVANGLIYRARRTDHELRLKIRRQNEELVLRNDELNQLMAITAHDLRSPLYGLRNLFDLVERRAEREPALPLKALRDGIFSLDAMIALVSRLLLAHSAEYGPLTEIARDDLRNQLVAAARRIGPQANVDGAEIVLTLPDDPVNAWFDAGALAQILDNLLSNAVRYSPRGASIDLECREEGGKVLVTVRDRGPGIAPPIRDILFKKFIRGVPSPYGNRAGSGLGLFIAARLADRLGAELTFQSGDAGGSTFQLAFRSGAAKAFICD